MKEFLKKAKADVVISAILCMVFGVVLILWPVQVTTIACQAIGCILIVMGILRILTYFLNREGSGFQMALGLVLLLVGVFILLRPDSIQSLLLIVIGVVLLVHGIEDFGLALEAKESGYSSWAALLLLALLSFVLGVVCIIDCFGVISVAMTFVGISLIYDGISDLWIVSRIKRAVRDYEEEMEAVDTQYQEEPVEEDEE